MTGRGVRGVAIGLGCWATAAVAGSLVGSRDWGRPQQELAPPYVSDVPGSGLVHVAALHGFGLLLGLLPALGAARADPSPLGHPPARGPVPPPAPQR